jgi:hypothetical protein
MHFSSTLGLRRRVLPAAAIATIIALVPAPAAANCPPGQPRFGVDPCPLDAPRWTGDLAVLGANAALGGLTAGLAQHLAGGSFRDGFTRGFFGGVVIYGGKRVAAERFPGAGLLGRELAAVGTSVVDNAAAGRGTLERLVLPVWIGRLYIDRGAGEGRMRVTPRLDAMAAFWTLNGVLEDDLSFDAGATLSAGTPVFRTFNQLISLGDDEAAAGLTAAGVVFLSDIPAFGEFLGPRNFAHERVHVLQMDQVFLHWTRPVERRLIGMVPGTDGLLRHVDLNLSTELLRSLGLVFPEHRERPWELEAIFLAR